ncbi:hypothetical protein L2E82_27461 [Cichorium intybus]|uniref:Uncharacterized protein n=1 Tax=Cichorium intybus TaxID=13427 RepID=A0ACB9CTF4_CICIN|nr:hypothetical protein L2E82_27461 [Cichorium intybus]
MSYLLPSLIQPDKKPHQEINSPYLETETSKGSANEQNGMLMSDKPSTSCQNKGCVKFSGMDKYTQKSYPDESKTLCADCLKQPNESCESFLGSSSRDDKENGEITDYDLINAEKFRFSAEFIEMRHQALDSFVNKIALHHELQKSEDLRTFLQADEQDVQSKVSDVVLGKEKPC